MHKSLALDTLMNDTNECLCISYEINILEKSCNYLHFMRCFKYVRKKDILVACIIYVCALLNES